MSQQISKIQIKLIKIGQKQIGLTDEAYREMLSDRYWKHSCTELTYQEASDLIDHFKTMGFAVATRKGTASSAPTKAKRKQYDSSIAGLREEVCDIAKDRWGDAWESTFNKWLLHYHKIASWRFMNVAIGVKAKKGLREMQTAGEWVPGSGDQQKTSPNPPVPSPELMTKQQLQDIELLKADIQWAAGPMGYYKWLKAYLKKDRISTYKEAEAVKKALKGMVSGEARKVESKQNYFRRDGGLHGGHYEW